MKWNRTSWEDDHEAGGETEQTEETSARFACVGGRTRRRSEPCQEHDSATGTAGRFTFLSLVFAGKSLTADTSDPELTLLLFVGDLSAPRARVKLADVLRQDGRRPRNIRRAAKEPVRLVKETHRVPGWRAYPRWRSCWGGQLEAGDGRQERVHRHPNRPASSPEHRPRSALKIPANSRPRRIQRRRSPDADGPTRDGPEREPAELILGYPCRQRDGQCPRTGDA